MAKNAPFRICNQEVAPGEARIVDIPLSNLSTHTPMTLPVHVRNGNRPGPVLFVSAAIHGDEIQGVEIIRRLLKTKALRRIKGTLLLIPIVNVFGFIAHDRYLPDGRDLNRSFPGSAKGSLAAQLANKFMTEIVEPSDYGIDIHTGLMNRSNLPQIRADLSQGKCLELGKAFGAPVLLNSNLRDGSLRQAAQEHGVDILLYEAGEALRFDEFSVRAGVKGVLRVMQHIGMFGREVVRPSRVNPVVSDSSSWVRSPAGGILRLRKHLGESVDEDEVLGVVSDPFGETEIEVKSGFHGVLIGRNNLPVINQGDAIFHIARVGEPEKAEKHVGRYERELEKDPLFNGKQD